MEAAIEGFLAHARVEKRLAANTLDAYARDLGALRAWLAGQGITSAAEVTRSHLGAYMGHLLDGGRGMRSAARHRTSFRQLFRFLVAERVLEVQDAGEARPRVRVRHHARARRLRHVRAVLLPEPLHDGAAGPRNGHISPRR